jgi:hypothetical protein
MLEKGKLVSPRAVIFVVILSLGFFGQAAYGQTVISGTSGSFSDGSSVTITGTGFGTKAVPGPLFWDDFEEGTNGVSISSLTTKGWTTSLAPGNSVTYSSENNRPGSRLNSKHDLQRGASGGNVARLLSPVQPELNKVFLSLWVRLDVGVPVEGSQYFPQRQVKLWRLIDAESDLWGYTLIKSQHWVYQNLSRNSYYQVDKPATYDTDSLHYTPSEGQVWHRVELQALQSSPGTPNGSIEIWHSVGVGSVRLSKVVDSQNVTTTRDNIKWRRLAVGESYTSGRAIGANYFDDIYLDNSWARVVIGDASTYNNCTTRETQIPRAWSPNSIAINVNLGAFSNTAAYLYVVNDAGVYNQNGYPITLLSNVVVDMDRLRSADNNPEDGSLSSGELAAFIDRWQAGNPADMVLYEEVILAIEWNFTGNMPTSWETRTPMTEEDLPNNIKKILLRD